jgi:hypothetical protein
MVNTVEAELGDTAEKGQSTISGHQEQSLTTKDKIQQLINENLDTLRLADLRSEWGGRELSRVIKQAEEIGHQRGFEEGIIEERVQETCNDIVGYMLAEVDDGRKSKVATVSLTESVEDKDINIMHQAMLRAKKIFINANLSSKVDFYTSQNEEGNTLFNFSLIINLLPEQLKSEDALTSEK